MVNLVLEPLEVPKPAPLFLILVVSCVAIMLIQSLPLRQRIQSDGGLGYIIWAWRDLGTDVEIMILKAGI